MAYWRSRAVIWTFARIQPGTYRIQNLTVVCDAAQPHFKDKVDDHLTLIDLFLGTQSEDPADVFVRSHDLVNEFLDRISVVSYGAARLAFFISTCPTKVEKGQDFDLISTEHIAERSEIMLVPGDLDAIPDHVEKSVAARIARLLRQALTSSSLPERFVTLYSVIEQLAEEATTDRDFGHGALQDQINRTTLGK